MSRGRNPLSCNVVVVIFVDLVNQGRRPPKPPESCRGLAGGSAETVGLQFETHVQVHDLQRSCRLCRRLAPLSPAGGCVIVAIFVFVSFQDRCPTILRLSWQTVWRGGSLLLLSLVVGGAPAAGRGFQRVAVEIVGPTPVASSGAHRCAWPPTAIASLATKSCCVSNRHRLSSAFLVAPCKLVSLASLRRGSSEGWAPGGAGAGWGTTTPTANGRTSSGYRPLRRHGQRRRRRRRPRRRRRFSRAQWRLVPRTRPYWPLRRCGHLRQRRRRSHRGSWPSRPLRLRLSGHCWPQEAMTSWKTSSLWRRTRGGSTSQRS